MLGGLREVSPTTPPDDDREPLLVREGAANVEEGRSAAALSGVDRRLDGTAHTSSLADVVLSDLPTDAPGAESSRPGDDAGGGDVLRRCRREVSRRDPPSCDDAQ
jgi:hypothetical protein